MLWTKNLNCADSSCLTAVRRLYPRTTQMGGKFITVRDFYLANFHVSCSSEFCTAPNYVAVGGARRLLALPDLSEVAGSLVRSLRRRRSGRWPIACGI